MASHQLSLAQRIGIHYYRSKIIMLQKVSAQAAAKASLDIFTKPHTNTKRKDTPFFKRAQRFWFQSGGLNLMGYQFNNQPSAVKKLLIIHGFAGSCRSFEKYIAGAVSKGYHVVTFDAPAHGLSQGKRLNTLEYRNAILELINTHGPFDAYMSHSLGGLSLMLALEEIKSASLPKVILLAPATESTTAANNFFNLLRLPMDIRPAFESIILSINNRPLSWYSVSRALPNVSAHILWIHDDEDATTPLGDVTPIMQQKPEHIQFYVTHKLGHSGIYKDAEVVNLVLTFL